jgi:hypothetical protein
MELCKHESINNGICDDCGMELGGTLNGTFMEVNTNYSEYHSYIDSSVVQPFEADLRNLNIPTEVKNMVMKLASTCPKETHRMGVRRQQLFSYIYLAYLQLSMKFDPDKLREDMKMNQREVNMALRIISGTSSVDIPLPTNGYEDDPLSAPVVVISPMVYIEDVCKHNNLEDYMEDIIRVSKNILEKNKILLEFNPKHIAISLARYYLLELGINIPKFAKHNGISDSILKQHVTRISKTKL